MFSLETGETHFKPRNILPDLPVFLYKGCEEGGKG
jgi:hypothetical protein